VSKIVLCVDDSATMQQVADITFRGTEFTYVGARGFDEGLDKARNQKPTVILADSHMPGNGKSGYDLCLALKSDAATSTIPVVILIGNAAPYDAVRGAQVGADANLPKPWDTQAMLEKVTEIVGKAGSGVARPGSSAGSSIGSSAAAAAPPTSGIGAGGSPPAPATSPGKAAAPPPAAAAAASASMPPRSATIMGMPTIKMPGGPGAPPAATPPTKTSVVAVPPIAPGGPGTSPSIRSPAPPPPASASSIAASAAMSRAPMIAGTPTKRSLLVERTLAKMAARLAEVAGLEPGSPELAALLKLSTEVVERIVWEVVPELAEQIIRENLHDLTARRS